MGVLMEESYFVMYVCLIVVIFCFCCDDELEIEKVWVLLFSNKFIFLIRDIVCIGKEYIYYIYRYMNSWRLFVWIFNFI